MATDDREAAGTTVLSLLAAGAMGFVVGAAVGILFAPKSGEETREELKEKAAALKDQVAEKANGLTAKAKELAADLKQRVPALQGEAGEEEAEEEPVTEAV